ncbi:hypothetical protein BHE74_00045848 [Ensete ventricosum]|nr:hypothetical protein BHE74_00045848 [Ensete ventricosum]
MQYVMKLLAVDIPMASGPDQRLFVLGDEQEYTVGGGLISKLRDPIVKAMSAEKEFEDLDQKEDEEDEIEEREEAERRQQEEKQRAIDTAETKRQTAASWLAENKIYVFRPERSLRQVFFFLSSQSLHNSFCISATKCCFLIADLTTGYCILSSLWETSAKISLRIL